MPILRPCHPKKSRWSRTGRWIIFACVAAFRHPDLQSQSNSPAPPPAVFDGSGLNTNSALKAIGPALFEIGAVRIDRQHRTISFPAFVNLREGNIEYLVVTATGKTHESLLRTEARPYHLQVALLLLGAKGAGSKALPQDPTQPLPGDEVQLELNWTDGRKTRRARAEDFVHDRKARGKSKRGPWVFTGSRIRDDGFAAELDGSIVSLITDGDALINNPRPGRADDDNWLVRTNGLPQLGAAVSVVIKLSR